MQRSKRHAVHVIATAVLLSGLLLITALVGSSAPQTAQASPSSGADTDSDTVPNYRDNCPTASNAGQADAEGDGLGDACDPGPATYNPDQDADGFANNTEIALGSGPKNGASTPESFAVTGSCDDSLDNDGDGQADSAAGPVGDRGCWVRDPVTAFSTTERVDIFPSVALVDFSAYGLPALGTVYLTGPTVIRLNPVGDSDGAGASIIPTVAADRCADTAGSDGLSDVTTEIVALELSGVSPYGPIEIVQDAAVDSTGVIEQLSASSDMPGCSFFDVHVRLRGDLNGDTLPDDVPAGPVPMQDPTIPEMPPVQGDKAEDAQAVMDAFASVCYKTTGTGHCPLVPHTEANVGGLVLDADTSALSLQSDSSSGSDAWLLAAVMGGSAAVALTLGGGVWYARRRRIE